MDLKEVIGLGVAGNFAGHLEQAGEAESFNDVKVADAAAPKALFPFYLPNPKEEMADSFLKTFPLSSDKEKFPENEPTANLQTEPELGLLLKINYDKDGKVLSLDPKYFGAYNDCSIRRPGAVKISTKKNWGSDTKGVSDNLITIDSFDANGKINSYRLACFLKRDGQLLDYGVDSAVRDYSYMYGRLLEWIVDKMNNQEDKGPAENIHRYLEVCNYPEYALISIGATRYTEFGETGYLKKGDVSYVVVYPEALSHSELREIIWTESWKHLSNISVLKQEVC